MKNGEKLSYEVIMTVR